MLVCGSVGINALIEKILSSTIDLLSQHLLTQTCWKLTIKTPDQCLWRRSFVLTVNFRHSVLVFLVFLLLALNRWNPSWEVRVTVPKTRDIALLLFIKHELKTCNTSEMDLFAKMVYSLKSLTILTRRSILRSTTGCWICIGYFFQIYI